MKPKSNSARNTIVILDQASGYLQIDMLEAYGQKFEKRAIVAGTIVERSTKLPHDVRWHRITKYNRSTPYKRIFTWLAGSFAMFWVVLKHYRKAHIVAITNPPFAIFIPWVLRCSYDVVVYDIYPDALVHYGYTKKQSLVYRIWASYNRKIFKKAQRVITLTKGMSKLVDAYMPENQHSEVIPLWSDAKDFTTISRNENQILKQTGCADKFVIVYSGNLGKTHPVEKLVELASYLDPAKFAIIIIGDGAKKAMLKELVKEKNIPHVHLLPWQPVELLSHNLHAGNINAVTLDEQVGDLSIPSKTFNILSIGNPVLGICSSQSGLAELIQENDCGIVSDPTDMKNLARTITELRENKHSYESMKENSLKASEKFTTKNALKYL